VYGKGKDGDLERHLKEVAEYTEKYPKSHRAWFLLGYLQMTSGEKPIRAKAPLAFRRALDIEPDDPIAWRYLELLTEPNQSWVPEFPEPKELPKIEEPQAAAQNAATVKVVIRPLLPVAAPAEAPLSPIMPVTRPTVRQGGSLKPLMPVSSAAAEAKK